MATQKCRHCQSEIDAKATTCPQCRKSVGGGGCGRLLVIATLGIVALIAVAVMVQDVGREEYSEGELAFVACQRFALPEVRDPASAEWDPSNGKAGVAIGNEQYRVVTWVRAKNALGGVVRHDVECVIDATGDQLQLVSLEFGEAQ